MSCTHYQTLGVGVRATVQEVRQSYRQLALRYHPDKNDGEDTHFKVIQAAYEVLGDEGKRRAYDHRLATTPLRPPPRRPASAPPRPPMTDEQVKASMAESLRLRQQRQFEEIRRRFQAAAKAAPAAATPSRPDPAPAAASRAHASDNPLWHRSYPQPTCCGLTKKNAPCKVKIGLVVLDGTATCQIHIYDKMKGLVAEWAQAAPSRSNRLAVFEASPTAEGEKHHWDDGEALYLRVRCPSGELKAGYRVRVGQQELGTCVAVQHVPAGAAHKSEQVNVQVLPAGETGVLKVQCIKATAYAGRWTVPVSSGRLASDDVITCY